MGKEFCTPQTNEFCRYSLNLVKRMNRLDRDALYVTLKCCLALQGQDYQMFDWCGLPVLNNFKKCVTQ